MLSFTSRKPLSPDEPFAAGSYLFLTSGTYQKKRFIADDRRKAMLFESLDFNCYKWRWRILAYAILDNHYHLVVQTPGGDASRISHIVQSAHSFCAHHWRREDPAIRTRIWWNFWDTPLKTQAQLVSHVNYVHENPRLHGNTDAPGEYAFSSYADYLAKHPGAVADWEKLHPASDVDVIDSF